MRELRTAHDAVQDDVVAASRTYGLGWVRSTVAMIESGQRGLSAEEFVALPLVLSDALATDVTMHDIIPTEPVLLAERLPLTPAALRSVLAGGTLQRQYIDAETGESIDGTLLARFRRSDDEDHKVSGRLGVTVEEVRRLTQQTWGRRFMEERVAREEAAKLDALSERSRRTTKGHIVRKMIDELRAVLEQEGGT